MLITPPIYGEQEVPDKYTHVNAVRLTRLASRDLASYIRQLPMYYQNPFLMEVLSALNEEEGTYKESVTTII